MAGERWVLTILICLFIILTILYMGTFATAKIEILKQRNLTAQNQQLQSQIQQQNAAVNTFVSQLQKCKIMEDVDNVLATINIERIK